MTNLHAETSAAPDTQDADSGAALPSDAQVLQQLASALFPHYQPERGSLTWSDNPNGATDAAGAVRSAVRMSDVGIAIEDRLRLAEARFRLLVEQIPAITFMAVLGAGNNEIYVSPHIESVLGFTQQEWLENPFLWYMQLHPDDRALWMAEFTRGCQTGGPFRAECRYLARDGRVVWVHGEARLIKDELGRPQFLQGVAFDITESKRAQEVLLTEAVRSARVEEELAIAHRLQKAILPKSFSVVGLDIAGTMLPASEVGGDYYDVLPFEGGAWIGIGDVSGHGINAGLVMLMVQSAIASVARTLPSASPSEIMCLANEQLYDTIRSRLDRDDHVTCALLRYSADGRVVFAGAHEDMIVCRRATGAIERIAPVGTWLGARPDIRNTTVDVEFRLDHGDLVVLYTDGVTEARDAHREQYDIDRLCEAVRTRQHESPQAICDGILAEVQAWMRTQDDDISILVLRHTRT